MCGIRKELYDKSPFELSGGQKRRVAIAGVMAMKPKVLILDEPTAGLDPKGRNEIFAMLKNYQKTTKSTLIIVSHSMEDVARVTERLIVMHHGQVQYDAPPVEVFRHYSELEKMGLSAPGVTYLMQKLAARNFKVRTDITTIGAAADEIIKALKKEETDKC